MLARTGQRVSVATVRGLPGEWEPLEVAGVIEAIEERPWGTDARVRLDEPTQIGNTYCDEPVAWLSLSADSPNLSTID